MKMSDVFEMPFAMASFLDGVIIDAEGIHAATCDEVWEAKAICHAVNHYDQIIASNELAVDMLRQTLRVVDLPAQNEAAIQSVIDKCEAVLEKAKGDA